MLLLERCIIAINHRAQAGIIAEAVDFYGHIGRKTVQSEALRRFSTNDVVVH